MKGTYLGEFEELVLLATAVLFDEAYGVRIQEELKHRCNRNVSISTVHAALKRLEKKGFAVSRLDGATPERGGRRKMIFRVTTYGEAALSRSLELRNSMWNAIPEHAFKVSGS